jgi:hypothetical protein
VKDCDRVRKFVRIAGDSNDFSFHLFVPSEAVNHDRNYRDIAARGNGRFLK